VAHYILNWARRPVTCWRLPEHFHCYCVLADIAWVWPFFGGTASSSAFPPDTPTVKVLPCLHSRCVTKAIRSFRMENSAFTGISPVCDPRTGAGPGYDQDGENTRQPQRFLLLSTKKSAAFTSSAARWPTVAAIARSGGPRAVPATAFPFGFAAEVSFMCARAFLSADNAKLRCTIARKAFSSDISGANLYGCV